MKEKQLPKVLQTCLSVCVCVKKPLYFCKILQGNCSTINLYTIVYNQPSIKHRIVAFSQKKSISSKA